MTSVPCTDELHVSVHGLHPPLPERDPAAGGEERRQARQQGGVPGVQEGGGTLVHDTQIL